MALKFLTAVVCVIASFFQRTSSSLQPMSDGGLQGLTTYGADALASEVQRLQKVYNASVNAFIPVNKTCNKIVEGKIEKCKSCVKTACTNRAQQACKPSTFEAIMAKGIGFFTQGIPGFFADTVKGVFVDKLGNSIVNVGGKIGDFLGGTIPDAFTDIGKTIGGGVVDIGKQIGHIGDKIGQGVVNVGKDIGKGVIDLGNGVVHLGKDILNGITGTIGKIGKIFGRRRSVANEITRESRAAEPGCDAIQHDSGSACTYYINTCSQCHVDPNVDCPNYKSAVEKITNADNARAWLAKATVFTYQVKSVKIDSASFDPASVGYKKVEATVALFGKTFTFTVNKPINPYNPVDAGPVLALQALAKFKAS